MQFDKNHDEYISREEIAVFVEEMLLVQERIWEQIVNQYDEDDYLSDQSDIDSDDEDAVLAQLFKRRLRHEEWMHGIEGEWLHLYNVKSHMAMKYRLVYDFGIARFSRTVVTADGRLFVIGGIDNRGQITNWMLQFDYRSRRLIKKASMHTARSDFTTVYEKKRQRIYCIGGGNIRACEYYDIVNDSWTRMADMTHPRESPKCTLVNNHTIYAFNGHTSEGVEKYNIETNTWSVFDINGLELMRPYKACGMAHHLKIGG